MNKAHRRAIDSFLAHWAKYTDIQPYHRHWIARHATYTSYVRGQSVYDSTFGEEEVFYVCSGLIGRIVQTAVPVKSFKKAAAATGQEEKSNDGEKKLFQPRRSILSVGTPGMALMTTDHLYTRTQSGGEIVALRPSEVLTIDYGAIKRFMIDDRSLDSMLFALSNKKKRQLARLRQVNAINDRQSRYIRFAETLPELHAVLSQTEQQDLLGISRRTISRASYLYATGKPKR